MNVFRPFALFLCCCLLPAVSRGQAQDLFAISDPPTFFQKVASEGWNRMQIATDFTTLLAKSKEDVQQAALVTVYRGESETLTLPVEIEFRGKKRRLTCHMPPVRLDFKNDELEAAGLSKNGDKIKLVTYCMDDKEAEATVLREFWAYRLYNMLTPVSYQVHPLEVQYLDVAQPEEKHKFFIGFLIESTEELATRLKMEEKEDLFGRNSETINREAYQNMLMFNYMIGNTDWSIEGYRNLKFFLPKDDQGDKPLIVPYDFDYSALVGAPYADPSPAIGQMSLQQRMVQGKFNSLEELDTVLQRFQSLQEPWRKATYDAELLNNQSKKAILDYLDTFFDLLDNEEWRAGWIEN